VASVCALDRWTAANSRPALIAAGCAAALAVGSRYDGWFYVLLATPTIAWICSRQRISWWRSAALFALPSAVMVVAWLGYNWAFFGDPLEFQRGVWSAQSQQAALAAQGHLPTAGRPAMALLYYLGATMLCAGALLTLAGIGGAAVVVRRVRDAGAPLLLLLSALPFNVLALWAGQSAIQLPWSHPGGVLNLRYGVMLLPGLAACAALAASHLVSGRPAARKGMLLACLCGVLAQTALFAVDWPANAGALREGLAIRDGDPRQQHASDWLAAHYDGGRILVDDAVNLSPRTRVPLRDRVYQWTWRLGPAALTAPEREVDWGVVDERHADGVVARALANREEFHRRFDRAFQEGGLLIWRRR
jgi:hypothetical protein